MLFLEIENVVKSLEVSSISNDRRKTLQPLIDFIQCKISNQQDIRLNFICTHNSRRSHLTQCWAQTIACYFNIKKVFCYSGGTETTALFSMVVETLKQTGFKVKLISGGSNPIYNIQYSNTEYPIKGFSKIYDDDINPKSDFAAILTCSQADADCPFIDGAQKRISIPYEDPKIFDNTLQQVEMYKKISLQIATELFYVFSKINKNVIN